MDLVYQTKTLELKTIPGVSKWKIVKTQAKPKPQFAPVALPPKPAGQGGQNEYLFLDGDDLNLYRLLNPKWSIRQWLWGHDRSGWIAWVEKKEVQRINKLNKKRKRKDWIPLHEGNMICWPAIAMLNNVVYIGDTVQTKRGLYGRLIGIPADALLNETLLLTHPGWIHVATNTKGTVIYRDGAPSYMPIYERAGRRSKAKGDLWINMDYLELVSE